MKQRILEPVPVWYVLTGRNSVLMDRDDGPIMFLREKEAQAGILKIQKKFKMATLLCHIHDHQDKVRLGSWEFEVDFVDDMELPNGAIPYKIFIRNRGKVLAALKKAGNGQAATPVVKKKKKRTAKTIDPAVVAANELKSLREDCKELGIKYSYNAKAETLRTKIRKAERELESNEAKVVSSVVSA